MADDLSACTELHAKPTFVIREKHSEVRFQNAKRLVVKQIVVDGCAIADDGVRCDALVNVGATGESVFVELKGSNVQHAVDQLARSDALLREHAHRSRTWIISTVRNPLIATETQRLIATVRRKHGANLILRNSPVDHRLS